MKNKIYNEVFLVSYQNTVATKIQIEKNTKALNDMK